MSFYAVANGRKLGVFETWKECTSSIFKYKNAVYKKFSTFEEANAFLKQNPRMDDILDGCSDDDVVCPESQVAYFVYTDGSCHNNGKKNAKAGIGVYFGENDPRNISRVVIGKQTNNTAELGAIIETYDVIKGDIHQGKKIGIISDSAYAIKCVKSYGEKCEKECWSSDIPNKELVKKAYTLYKGVSNVFFVHIMAHTGKTDIHSLGNEGADKLANKAIGLESCPYNTNIDPPKSPKSNNSAIYLQVSYDEKEEAKLLGAKWDHKKKKWYIQNDNPKKEEILTMFSQ